MGLKVYIAEKCIQQEVSVACDILSGGGLFSFVGLEVSIMLLSWCLIHTLPLALSWHFLVVKPVFNSFIGKLSLVFALCISAAGAITQISAPIAAYFIEIFLPSDDVWRFYYWFIGEVPNVFKNLYLRPLQSIFDFIFQS